MNLRSFGTLNTSLTMLVVAGSLAVASIAMARRPQATAAATQSAASIGDALPALELKTPNGEPVALRERLGGRPALLYVFGTAECASCSNLQLEFRIVRREAPKLTPLVIASGASVETFKPYLAQMGIGASALVDEHRALLKAVGQTKEPLVLLIGGDGRILMIDPRSAPRAAQFPMGRILHELVSVLGADRPIAEQPAAVAPRG